MDGCERTGGRYYSYISDARPDLLFDQIPQRLLTRFAADFAINLKVVSVSVRTAQSEATRFGKLQLVERHIDEDHEVGWVTEPTPWFRGDLGLRSGIHRDGLVLSTGLEHDTLVALIGSAHHLAPAPGTAQRGRLCEGRVKHRSSFRAGSSHRGGTSTPGLRIPAGSSAALAAVSAAANGSGR
ncbi:DUF7019 family protein [Streptomyces lunaelactis]|uniref:DUF7019 family protein n=1 Tax=Streptomyces lunaelactis TaxID=1535768 RepID=UPI0035A1C5B6